MKKVKNQFLRYGEYLTYYLSDWEKEALKRMELACEREDGIKVGKEEGMKVGKEEGIIEGERTTISEIIEYKYHRIPLWLKDCSKVQLQRLKQLLVENLTYEEIENIIMNDNKKIID